MKSMKFIVLALGLFFSLVSKSIAFAQPGGDWTEKISWTFSVEKVDDSHGFVVGKAKIIPGWHTFSVKHDPTKADGTGFVPRFVLKETNSVKLDGKLKELGKPKTHVDDLGTSLYFENSVTFKQGFIVLKDGTFDLPFEFQFQVCDENGCLFPTIEKVISVKGMKALALEEVTPSADTNLPENAKNPSKSTATEKKHSKVKLKKAKNEDSSDSKSWLAIFIGGFGGGLIALLTPCMFPMIPMTVTFFTKGSGGRKSAIGKALLFGISIIVIYVVIGLLVTIALGPTGLQKLSTSITMNLIFFAVFMLFAFSFLGAFEIRLPAKWVNKSDEQVDKRSGLLGIFFMAFTLGLVSFSCTGPIIGTLLVEAANTGSIMAPAMGMTGFALALAIPFTLFAIFPSWLSSLPQSGGWLNSVKVVLGLLEIALALKFLSSVDLDLKWGILTREVFVSIWVVIFAVIGFYLLGKLRFAHDSAVEKLSVTRFMFALSSLVFALYLLPGLWGAPLSAIEGIAPPRTWSEDGFRFNKGESSSSAMAPDTLLAAYSSDLHEVADGSIKVFHDLEKGREYAKKANKPILIDFTGIYCQNCRRTENKVWTNDGIRPTLQNDMVIISLYTDDKTELPESEWKYSDAIKGRIKTIGDKWADYQVTNYGKNSQPLYIVADADGNDLTEAIGYTPDIEQYKAFLQKGIKAYKSKK